ncbi:MAG: 4Fe-4S binding protein [Eubacteriales bacterium]|nr:4Fe-4S binding protein [Eubacteriales bacterium]
MSALTVSAADVKRVKALGFLNNKGTDNFSGRILTVNGKITAAQQRCIADAAEKFGNGNITFTTRLTVEVQGIPYEKIEDFRAFVAKEGLETGGTGALVRPVTACKGTTCQYGLLDSFGIAEEIHNRFYKGYHEVKLPHKFKIAVGGCPNNCLKPDLNDVGIIGQRIPKLDEEKCKGCKKCEKTCPVGATKVVDKLPQVNKDLCNNCGRCIKACPFGALDQDTYGYKIYIGGRWGKQVAQGRALTKIFTDKEEALNVIEKAILLFREQGKPGERFSTTIERLGFENVEAQLLSNDLLERKQQIISE